MRHADIVTGGKLVEVEQAGVQPLLVGQLRCELGLDLLVVDDAALGGVHQEHAARLQPHLLHHGGRIEVEHAGLGGHHNQAVSITQMRGRRRPLRSSTAPITVPSVNVIDAGPSQRLHQRRVVLVERTPGRVHRLVAFHASGIIISTRMRQAAPPRCSSSSTSSKRAVSEAPGCADRDDLVEVLAGAVIAAPRGPKASVLISASRARIQFSLPVTVSISPL